MCKLRKYPISTDRLIWWLLLNKLISHNKIPLQEMLHFVRGRSPVAFCQGQKLWQNAEILGRWTFARSFARSRITSKSAHRKWTCQGFSSWQMRSWHRPWLNPWQIVSEWLQAFADCVSITSVIFKPCQEHCEGLTPGKLLTIFFKKNVFLLFKKSKY